jgi:glyoxylase-like metal-dependent hydrolase (beta-lactamase superfamily II)
MTALSVSRRQALWGTAAAIGSAGAFRGLGVQTAHAKAPLATDQAPYYYRFNHGKIQATIVSDGPLHIGEPSASFLATPKEEIAKMLTDNFLSPTNVVLEQNVLVLNTGDKMVLFDTGMGSSKIFGPNAGKLLSTLKAASIDPKDIDAVVATHAHQDHIWGIMADDGSRHFPNAQIYISKAEFAFWTDEAKLGMTDPPYMKMTVEGARKNLLPNRDRMVFFKDGQEFLPGIQAMSTPGHTVGHTVFMITSDGKTLAVIGDLTHHQVLLTLKPRLQFINDTYPEQAAKTRVRVLDMLATNRIPLLGYHFPWPGLGHVAKFGDGFQYFPAPMQMVSIDQGAGSY